MSRRRSLWLRRQFVLGENTPEGGVLLVRWRRPRRAQHIVARLSTGSPAAEVDHLAGRAAGTRSGGRTIASPGEGLQGDVSGPAGPAEPGEVVQQREPGRGLPA